MKRKLISAVGVVCFLLSAGPIGAQAEQGLDAGAFALSAGFTVEQDGAAFIGIQCLSCQPEGAVWGDVQSMSAEAYAKIFELPETQADLDAGCAWRFKFAVGGIEACIGRFADIGAGPLSACFLTRQAPKNDGEPLNYFTDCRFVLGETVYVIRLADYDTGRIEDHMEIIVQTLVATDLEPSE